jgi:hypothetical protein
VSVPLSDLAYAGIFYHLILSGTAHLGIRKRKIAAGPTAGHLPKALRCNSLSLSLVFPSPTALAFQETAGLDP